MVSFESDIRAQWTAILEYWCEYTVDHTRGGFYGLVSEENIPDPEAKKGSVLNSRILWTFSSAYFHNGSDRYFLMADRAFQYIRKYFTDYEFGGLYWSINPDGQLHDGRKQIYAQAFGLYALSEYYRATQNPEALMAAINLFNLIEKYSHDTERGGYLEAFQQNWTAISDRRLSARDDNAPKTMNTHLHIIEAYANLYEVWPDPLLKKRIEELLQVFLAHILDPVSHHLRLFFDEEWRSLSGIVSFGHDIEAGWLLQQCAEKIGHAEWIGKMKKAALLITRAALEGTDTDGGLWYEWDPSVGELQREKHWWPQAEAMVGLMNAWQVSGDITYRKAMEKNWHFIKKHILSPSGEWHWGIEHDYSVMAGQDKAGFWKCPYHNSRCCLEILLRLPETVKIS